MVKVPHVTIFPTLIRSCLDWYLCCQSHSLSFDDADTFLIGLLEPLRISRFIRSGNCVDKTNNDDLNSLVESSLQQCVVEYINQI